MKKLKYVLALSLIMVISGSMFVLVLNNRKSFEIDRHYTLRDDYFDQNNFNTLTNNPDAVFELAKFNEKLHTSNLFDYFEIVTDRLYVVKNNYLGNETYGADYEFDKESYKIDYDDIALIKSVLISQDFLEYHNITLDSGRYFEKKDFIFNSDDVNVILGSDYKTIYNVGDRFDIIYLGYARQAHIIGFVDENMTVEYADLSLNLNKYIIAPFENFDVLYPLHTEQGNYQFKLYLDKNSGILYSEKKKRYIEEEIISFSKESNLLPYKVC